MLLEPGIALGEEGAGVHWGEKSFTESTLGHRCALGIGLHITTQPGPRTWTQLSAALWPLGWDGRCGHPRENPQHLFRTCLGSPERSEHPLRRWPCWWPQSRKQPYAPASCNHLWPKAVILTRDESQTSSQLFSLTKQIFQPPPESRRTICVSHTRLLFPSKAGVCSDASSLNLQGHTCCEPALLGNPDPLKSWRHSPRDRLIFCPHLVLFKPEQTLCWA